MMNFIQHARLTSPFKGYSAVVAQQVGHQHTGIDEVKGYGKPWITDASGYVYKIYKPDNNFNWSGIHILVETDNGTVEYIPLGHASKVSVKEGDNITTGMIVGCEGNHGMVFSNGRRITVKERQEGSHKGTHNHRGVRPVIPTKTVEPNRHYLRNVDGSVYCKEGIYWQIKYTNNTKGWVNPNDYYPKLASTRFELMALDASANGNIMRVRLYWSIHALLKSFNS